MIALGQLTMHKQKRMQDNSIYINQTTQICHRFHHAIGNNGTPETTKKEVVKIQDPGKNSQV
ncbi:hypothetical protein ACQP3L_40300, partial [Escherichia coli]